MTRTLVDVVLRIRFSVELISPERAVRDLENRRSNNRNISIATVASYVRAMQNGQWRADNAVAIKYNPDGKLIDGQHRLAAVRDFGQAVEMLVAYNVPDDAMATIDYGRGRSVADHLAIENKVEHSVVVAAVARRVWAWQNGRFLKLGGFKFTPLDTAGVLEQNPEILEAVAFSRIPDMCNMRTTLTTSARSAFISWLLKQIDSPEAEEFLLRLSTGEGLKKLEPVYALREALLRSERAGRSTTTETQQMYLMILGWNHHRKGHTSKLLKLPVVSLTWENFPKPI